MIYIMRADFKAARLQLE